MNRSFNKIVIRNRSLVLVAQVLWFCLLFLTAINYVFVPFVFLSEKSNIILLNLKFKYEEREEQIPLIGSHFILHGDFQV